MAALIRRQPSAQYHHVLNQSLAHNTGQNAQICFLFAKMLPEVWFSNEPGVNLSSIGRNDLYCGGMDCHC